MPISPTYPGVYVEEIPSISPTVTGVSTSSTAFVDFFPRGEMNQAKKIQSFEEFSRSYGGFHPLSESSYGLDQFFRNGGRVAWVVRVGEGAQKAYFDVDVKTPTLREIVAQAAEAVRRAAEAERKATQASKDMVDETNSKQLEARAREAEGATMDAATATRDAADAASNAGAVLNVEIEKSEAAAGEYLDFALTTANQSAAAAAGAHLAAQATESAAKNAEAAAKTADRSIQIGQQARRAEALAKVLESEAEINADKLAGALTGAAKAADFKTQADAATEVADARRLAQDGAREAERIANEAIFAAQDAVDAAGIGGDIEGIKKAQSAEERAEEAKNTARQAVDKAERAADLAAAKAVAADAVGAANEAVVAVIEADQAALVAAYTAARNAVTDTAQRTALEKARNTLADATKDADDVVAGKLPATADAVFTKERKDLVTRAQAAATAAINAALNIATISADPKKAVKALEKDPDGIAEQGRQVVKDAGGASRNARSATLRAANAAKKAASEVGAGQAIAQAQGAQLNASGLFDRGKASNKEINTLLARFDGAVAGVRGKADAATAANTALAQAQPADLVSLSVAAAEKAGELAEAATDSARLVQEATSSVSKSALLAAEASEIAASADGAVAIAINVQGTPLRLRIEAANEGVWGNYLQITVEPTRPTFTLVVEEWQLQPGRSPQRVANERFDNLDLEAGGNSFGPSVVNAGSNLVRLEFQNSTPPVRGAYPVEVEGDNLAGGQDGEPADATNMTRNMRGALDHIAPDIFNILCLPATASFSDGEAVVALSDGLAYCQERRAVLLVDIPERIDSIDDVRTWTEPLRNAANYSGAVYFPRLIVPDPLADYRPRNVGASGTLAGIYARTDARRGVWKAPAGINAAIQGANLAVIMTDLQNGEINPYGINALRSFPVYGTISWGARTLAGADLLNSEWKYISVRRLANYIEESLFQSLKWAVFEPNDEILWGRIRSQIGSFLAGLFAQGAFQGTAPGGAYFVKCDATTTTQVEIDQGIVNVVVGFAPVKPAEFVILKIQQIAGQAQ